MIFQIAFVASIVAILYGYLLTRSVLKKSAGDQKMRDIQSAIQEGARAYLKRQNQTVFWVGLVVAVVLYIYLSTNIAIGFVLGALASMLAGYMGMTIAVKANARVAEEARIGIKEAFALAYKGGAVTGFFVVGLALLSVTGFYWWFNDVPALVGLAFGSSLISVFARLGGGIFTKGADVGADLVGKIEAGIPEDDPRNPAVIADNVGDNVGDDAGMAADLFETYVVSASSVMILANLLYPRNQSMIELPLLIGAVAIVASIFGSSMVKMKTSIMGALYKGLAWTALFLIAAFWWIAGPNSLIVYPTGLHIFWQLMMGIIVTAGMMLITEYYTSKSFRPVQAIAKASTTGHGTNVIAGLAISMESTAKPVALIGIAMLASYGFGGIFGIAIASMSMLSLAGIILRSMRLAQSLTMPAELQRWQECQSQ